MDLGDYHAVRNFIVQAVGQNKAGLLDASEVARLISETLSEDIGTTIKTEDEASDPYGFVSLAPLRDPKDEAVRMLRSFHLKTCDQAHKARLAGLLESGTVGVVFMERFVNLPAEVAGPVYQRLFSDYEHAVREDASFKVDHVLLATPTYAEVESDLDREFAGKGTKRARSGQPRPSGVSYYYGEAELLPQYAEFHWDYEVDGAERSSDSKRAFGDLGVIAGRRVFCLRLPKFRQYVDAIEAFIREAE